MRHWVREVSKISAARLRSRSRDAGSAQRLLGACVQWGHSDSSKSEKGILAATRPRLPRWSGIVAQKRYRGPELRGRSLTLRRGAQLMLRKSVGTESVPELRLVWHGD